MEMHMDFMRAYRETVMEIDRTSVADYVKEAVKKPSSRFWIDASTLEVIICNSRLSGLPVVNKSKHRMYCELLRRFSHKKDEFPEMSVYDICEELVEEPAPEFYISVSTGVKIVCSNNSSKRRLRHEKK